MTEEVSFPLSMNVPVDRWADMFPARHGRVSFGEFSKESRFSVPMARFMSSIHYEFSDFHKKLAQPLMEEAAGLSELIEYAFSLVERMENAKSVLDANELSAVSQASLVMELVQFCFVENEALSAGRFPRWLLRHVGIPIEQLVMEADAILESEGAIFLTDEPKFWGYIKQLALLDLSPVVSKLLRRYIEIHTVRKSVPLRYSLDLLASYFEEVPSLFDIAAAARSHEEAILALEKRRQFASVALHKIHKDITGEAGDVVRFLWKLQINREEDYEDLIREIMSIRFTEDDPWFVSVMLGWTWLHSLDTPDADLVRALGTFALDDGKSLTEASIVDAAVHAILSNDLPSLLSLLVQENQLFCGPWLPALLGDVCFYAGAIPGEIRDSLLLNYCHWLSASGVMSAALGRRIAGDVVLTLSEKALRRAGPEILGRLSRSPSVSAKQWLAVIKLCPMDQDWAESICLEKYQSDIASERVVDAIHSLSLAAEVGADVHIGACRISDFIDGNGEMVKQAFQEADRVARGLATPTLLPEYIESGRFDFYSQWTNVRDGTDLVRLALSPNCPPEEILSILSEIRDGVERKQFKLETDEIIALLKLMTDMDLWIHMEEKQAGPIEVLLAWLSAQLVSSNLAL